MNIIITPETLTDGSVVHNVSVGTTVFHAVSEADARDFAEKIAAAIDEHTTEIAELDEAA